MYCKSVLINKLLYLKKKKKKKKKKEREKAVRALLKGRDVLAVLPTGYSPREKRFCHCPRTFQKSIAPFHA